jgi:anti-anti-sigma factor
MKLTLDVLNPTGTSSVKVAGHISQSRFPAGVADPLVELFGPVVHSHKVSLNMELVDYIDSSGIGWLIGSHKRFREGGGQLILARLPPGVAQILRFCGLETLFTIERD